MKGFIIITCFICHHLSLFSQKIVNHQYFYNKVLDKIIHNDGFLLSGDVNLFLFKDKQIAKKDVIYLLSSNYKNLHLDTVTTFTFPDNLIIFNQVNIIHLPLDFQSLSTTGREEYCKIFVTTQLFSEH